MQGIEQQIKQFAGERIAENLSEQPPGESVDNLMNRPFQALSDADKKILQREVRRLAAALKTRIALRQKRAKSGQLDPKATIRANLKYHGVPMEIHFRDKTRKPKIVVICDVSTSMRFCSELMLSFLFALQGQVRKTHAFAFIDHLEYISDDFNGSNADEAITSVLWRMPSGHYNTDLGWSLNDFNNEYLNTLNGQTTLIVVGDGRNNYNDPRLDIFSQMSRRAARTIWLNPEPPHLWHGDSDMPQICPALQQRVEGQQSAGTERCSRFAAFHLTFQFRNYVTKKMTPRLSYAGRGVFVRKVFNRGPNQLIITGICPALHLSFHKAAIQQIKFRFQNCFDKLK